MTYTRGATSVAVALIAGFVANAARATSEYRRVLGEKMSLKGAVAKGQVITILTNNSPGSTGHILVTYHFVRKQKPDEGDGIAIPMGAQDGLQATVPADAIKMVVVIDMPDTGGSAVVEVKGSIPPVAPEAIKADPTTWTFAVIP
jgi:hypothetical protein